MGDFATSHGKSPYDGIGGTVKRLTAQASLKRTVTGHILDVDKMFEFCETNIKTFNSMLQKTTLNKSNILKVPINPPGALSKNQDGVQNIHQASNFVITLQPEELK
ncbi:hypothetical protein GQR58_015590 [Nymphon striatum]|nr:hypothetical protein GQR58_015590 [Nymphon striatum]